MLKTIISESELPEVATELTRLTEKCPVVLLEADMGVGKTTFVKAICKEIGVSDNVSSPTFSIVNEYRSEGGPPIYHFDLYRLKNVEELFDIGFEEYLDSGYLCLIEWPALASGLLPTEHILVEITQNGSDRTFKIDHRK